MMHQKSFVTPSWGSEAKGDTKRISVQCDGMNILFKTRLTSFLLIRYNTI